jgi:tRNA threonylcarbamoyladenosine biosynthesis protein TsaB
VFVLLDTSTPICRITLVDGDAHHIDEWRADRALAHGLLGRLAEVLQRHGRTMKDIEGIGVMRGPGSFTGLRIGLTVVNTIADSQSVPIVGATGDNWQQEVIDKLSQGQSDQIVLPFYGAAARITTPRK